MSETKFHTHTEPHAKLEMNVRSNKYSQVFNRVGMGYRELTKWIILLIFLKKDKNCDVTIVKYHVVSCA
jgi:hypothetical protein